MRTKVSVFFVSFTMLSELTQCSSQDPLTARLPQNLLPDKAGEIFSFSAGTCIALPYGKNQLPLHC